MLLLKVFSSLGAFFVVLLLSAIGLELLEITASGASATLSLVAAVVTWIMFPSGKTPSEQSAQSPHTTATDQGYGQPAESSAPPKELRNTAVIQRSIPVVDEHWAAALSEYDSGERSAGLFARLFAECGGDETRIKVAYLKERAQSLASEESQRAFKPQEVLQSVINLTAEASSFGITFDGEHYRYKTYRFEAEKDAISFARSATLDSSPSASKTNVDGTTSDGLWAFFWIALGLVIVPIVLASITVALFG